MAQIRRLTAGERPTKITRGSGGTARWAFVELMLPARTASPTKRSIVLRLFVLFYLSAKTVTQKSDFETNMARSLRWFNEKLSTDFIRID